jgi:hypothetical protein
VHESVPARAGCRPPVYLSADFPRFWSGLFAGLERRQSARGGRRLFLSGKFRFMFRLDLADRRCGEVCRAGEPAAPHLIYRRIFDFSGEGYLQASSVIGRRWVNGLRSRLGNFRSCSGLIRPIDVVGKCAAPADPPPPIL